MDGADAAGVAREVGVTVRPRKILYVTTDLFIGGGAEGMLARMATARPALADDITVVSLLRGQSHADELRAAGVTVVELDFRSIGGIVSGLHRLARLIADRQPDIVQGWMYHGDLAALIALGLSGRRRQTALVWSIRCSDMDLTPLRPRAASGGESLRGAVAPARSRHRQFDCRPGKPFEARLSPTASGGRGERRRRRPVQARPGGARGGAHRTGDSGRCHRAGPCRARRPDEGSPEFSGRHVGAPRPARRC